MGGEITQISLGHIFNEMLTDCRFPFDSRRLLAGAKVTLRNPCEDVVSLLLLSPSLRMALTNMASPVGGWYSVKTSNPVASQYLLAPNASAITTADISWQDPMDDLVLMANELAFRTAFATTTEVVGNVSRNPAVEIGAPPSEVDGAALERRRSGHLC